MQMNRREFLAAAFVTYACLQCPSLAAAQAAAVAEVDCGTLDALRDIPVNNQFSSKGFFLVVQGGKLFAPASICTHQPVSLVLDKKDQAKPKLACTKHEAAFDLSGKVLYGPPKKVLPRLGIHLDDQGHVIVTPAKKYQQNQWNNAKAFLPVPPAATQPAPAE